MWTRSLLTVAVCLFGGCTFGTFRAPTDAPAVTRSKAAQLKCGQADSLSKVTPDSTPPVCVRTTHRS